MVRCMRLSRAIDNIEKGSNPDREIILLLCEIADLVEVIRFNTDNTKFDLREEIIKKNIEEEVIPCQVNVEKVAKKRGRPFKEVKDANSKKGRKA